MGAQGAQEPRIRNAGRATPLAFGGVADETHAPVPETEGTRTWSLRAPRGLLLVVLVLVQVMVPLVATLDRVPSKLGFHMFVGYEPWTLTVRDSAGEQIEVDRLDWMIVPREDVDWAGRLAPAVCADVSEATEVVVRQWSRDAVVTCEP